MYLFIGCCYFPAMERYIENKYVKRKSFSVSNLIYERKLFEGFLTQSKDCWFLSAPSVGRYPLSCKKIYFQENCSENIFFAKYNTVSGIHYFSKTNGIYAAFRSFYKKIYIKGPLNIILCEMHYPYLAATKKITKFLRKKGIDFTVTIVCPDIVSNVFEKKRMKNLFYYAFKKFFDSKTISLSQRFNRYVLFTEQMATALNLKKYNYIVESGIQNNVRLPHVGIIKNKSVIKILFAGKLDEINGIKLILSSLNFLDQRFQLYICGSGPEEEMVHKASQLDPRINFLGFLNHSEVLKLQDECDILLSIRDPQCDVVKHSFPSKFFETLSAGKPTITYFLPTYDYEVSNFVYCVTDFTPKSLADKILEVVNDEKYRIKQCKQVEYLNYYSPSNVARRIIDFINKENKL